MLLYCKLATKSKAIWREKINRLTLIHLQLLFFSFIKLLFHHWISPLSSLLHRTKVKINLSRIQILFFRIPADVFHKVVQTDKMLVLSDARGKVIWRNTHYIASPHPLDTLTVGNGTEGGVTLLKPYCASDTCADCFTGIVLFHVHKTSVW